jgi:hypothetical protein
MAVYLGTCHAYRSWDEDHPKGYVQRDGGLQEPSEGMAQWRGRQATDEPARFSGELQEILHGVVVEIAAERRVQMHAASSTPTHIHGLFSFRDPACTCGATRFCLGNCAARLFAEGFITRLKRKMGQQLAKHEGTRGRPWFSRGWDLTPVRKREHFDYLVGTYLPEHQTKQGGIFRRYG